jgi:KUP system potassium uptake protein
MHDTRNKSGLPALSLGAIGVVYGDIGTSPLYTLNTIFAGGPHAVPLTADNVLGIVSLIFWSLMVVVSFKYIAFIMRADNRGEGGIMALMALALRKLQDQGRLRAALMLLGILGAALFYGDGIITPAISVLSAVEGLQVAGPAFKTYVLPITIALLAALFLFQRRGTASVGALFGPVMCVWFVVIGVLGALNIANDPSVLRALNPLYGLAFLKASPWIGFLSLGGVLLALTGAEALYADMGHFGRKPIQLAWFGLVLPALMLNYFGQGALLIGNPKAIENPFYLLAPGWALYPLVVLSAAATVIASQAVISGAYSMTQQATQLGYAPRMETQHTSEREIGQIYLPAINWAMLLGVVALVLGFGSSANLAAAYGIAVSGTMTITTVLAFVVVRNLWGWGWVKGGALIIFLLTIDLAFFSANLIKIREGGWLPLALGLLLFLLLTTWKRGRALLQNRLESDSLPLAPFAASMQQGSVARVSGAAIFLHGDPDSVPRALLHNLKHNKVLHEHVVVLCVRMLDIPHAAEADKVESCALPNNFYRLIIKFGFKDDPDIPKMMELAAQNGLPLEPMETSYFIGRQTLIPRVSDEMPLWREKLFIAMYRNAGSIVGFFKIPPGQVVELGTQVVL